MDKRCTEKQQLPAWFWRFATKEQLPSSEDGALESCSLSQQAQQGDYAAGDMGQVHLLEERRQIILILVSCSFHPKD